MRVPPARRAEGHPGQRRAAEPPGAVRLRVPVLHVRTCVSWLCSRTPALFPTGHWVHFFPISWPRPHKVALSPFGHSGGFAPVPIRWLCPHLAICPPRVALSPSSGHVPLWRPCQVGEAPQRRLRGAPPRVHLAAPVARGLRAGVPLVQLVVEVHPLPEGRALPREVVSPVQGHARR